jgi:phosphoribosyl 1,2-cyclic phosphodiesterase
MRIHLLASGSSGNCALIEAGQGQDRTVLCLDCGIAQRTARDLAQAAGLELTRVDGVLLSHHHADHSHNVVGVAARAKAPLFAHPEALAQGRKTRESELRRRGVETPAIADREPFQVGPLTVTPVRLPHDAVPTFGFLFEADGQRAGFFTDLGSPEVLADGLLDGLDLLVLEANHDRDMLRHGPYPRHLQERVGGPLGHLANEQTAEVLAAAAPPTLRQLVLAHLSTRNNLPEIALGAAADALDARGLGGIRLEAAPARGLMQAAP